MEIIVYRSMHRDSFSPEVAVRDLTSFFRKTKNQEINYKHRQEAHHTCLATLVLSNPAPSTILVDNLGHYIILTTIPKYYLYWPF